LIVLLPGMDGTGIMLRPFMELLSSGFEVKVVSYPEDVYLTHQQLAERVRDILPRSDPYVIVAESYSGPIACLLAAHSVGDLRAVVFVASFASLPWGRVGSWIAKILPTAFFRARMPAGILSWLLMDGATPEMISEAQGVIALVRPEVLAQRLRDSLNADFAPVLRNSTVRIVCLFPESDRLLGIRALGTFLAARPDAEIVTIAGPHSLLQCAPARSLAILRQLGVLSGS
jgi:pimeloyl-[acyl-carrier protein] methyl ester esterase